jgi:hypothetical protein
MTTYERIQKSREGLKESQTMSVTYELLQLYYKLIDEPTDKYFQANLFVQIVSANESFFKEAIASLIDSDPKYLNNSKNLVKRVGFKFDLDDIFHIAKSNITIGDVIAYSLKYSSIESLLKTFQEISELDILNQLSTVEESIINDDDDQIQISETRPLDKNRIIKNLKKVYEIRNVICHDFLSATHKLTFEITQLREYLLDAILLQNAVMYLCSAKIYFIQIPFETEERIKYYQQIIEEKTAELSKLYQTYEQNMNPSDMGLFQKSKKAFDKYLEADSNFSSGMVKMFFDLEFENKILLLDQRIKNISEAIRHSE